MNLVEFYVLLHSLAHDFYEAPLYAVKDCSRLQAQCYICALMVMRLFGLLQVQHDQLVQGDVIKFVSYFYFLNFFLVLAQEFFFYIPE